MLHIIINSYQYRFSNTTVAFGLNSITSSSLEHCSILNGEVRVRVWSSLPVLFIVTTIWNWRLLHWTTCSFKYRNNRGEIVHEFIFYVIMLAFKNNQIREYHSLLGIWIGRRQKRCNSGFILEHISPDRQICTIARNQHIIVIGVNWHHFISKLVLNSGCYSYQEWSFNICLGDRFGCKCRWYRWEQKQWQNQNEYEN